MLMDNYSQTVGEAAGIDRFKALPQDVLDLATCSWLAQYGRGCALCNAAALNRPSGESWPVIYGRAICLDCFSILHKIVCSPIQRAFSQPIDGQQ